MTAVEIVNLVLAVAAIALSVLAMFLSYKWNRDAEQQLSDATAKLSAIEKAADKIGDDVDRRLDDLVRRAAPSVDERAQTDLMVQLFPQMLQNPQLLQTLMDIGEQQGKKT